MKYRVLLILLVLMLSIPAHGAYWEDRSAQLISCSEGNLKCEILQMVMMGSFDFYESDNPLSARVLSAALDSLCLVEDSDFDHFARSFGVEEAVIRRYYYIALGNCFWADIDLNPQPLSDAQRILLLFLNPSAEEDAFAQMEEIRSRISDDVIDALAREAGVPGDFVYYLIYSDDWRELEVSP